MKQLSLTEDLYRYILDISLREHPVLAHLRATTATLPAEISVMQIPPDQAQFMQFLLRIIQAKKVLELGTFTGYSALAMALALPDKGELLTLDINAEWTKDAHKYWQAAGQDHKITLKLAPALESLDELINSGQARSFDFIFIDADKSNYVNYYNYALKLLSPKGIIAIDNVLKGGNIVDPTYTNAQINEIRRLNTLIKADERVDISLLSMADGLFLVKLRN